MWKLDKIAPRDEIKYTITVAGPAVPSGTLFKDSIIGWNKPVLRPGLPDLALKDERMLKKFDYVTFTFPQQ